jgi:hypothetical protein
MLLPPPPCWLLWLGMWRPLMTHHHVANRQT